MKEAIGSLCSDGGVQDVECDCGRKWKGIQNLKSDP
jgi:hypothetical protein